MTKLPAGNVVMRLADDSLGSPGWGHRLHQQRHRDGERTRRSTAGERPRHCHCTRTLATACPVAHVVLIAESRARLRITRHNSYTPLKDHLCRATEPGGKKGGGVKKHVHHPQPGPLLTALAAYVYRFTASDSMSDSDSVSDTDAMA